MLFHWHNIIHEGVSLEHKSFHLWDTILLVFNTCVMFTCTSGLTSVLGIIHTGQDGVLSRDVFSCHPLLSIFYVYSKNSSFRSLFFPIYSKGAKPRLFLLASARRKDFIWMMGKITFLPNISSGNVTLVHMYVFKLYQ